MPAATTLALVGGGALVAGSAVGNYLGAKAQANAAGDAAMAQQQMAQQVLAQQQKDRQTALGLAQPGLSELAMIQEQQRMAHDALTAQLTSLRGDEELLNSVDPALKSAGQQAYQLLQGKQAAAIAPMTAMIDKQRDQLKSTLRQQLGAGFETSSAGANALANFDMQANAQIAGIQQQTLGQFLGLSAQVRPDLSGKISRAYSTSDAMLQSALAAQQNIQARKVAAFNQMTPNYQNVINTAGAQYVGDIMSAKATQGLMNGLGQLGGIGLGYGLQNMTMGQTFGGVSPTFGGGGGGGAPGTFQFGNPGSMTPTGYNSTYFGTIH